MGNAFFVVWRESLEAFLIAGILFAWLQANDDTGRGKRALFGGLAAGAGLALLLGWALVGVQDELTGNALEAFQIGMLLVAAGLITQMVLWMRRHGRTLKYELEQGLSQNLAQRNWWGVALLAALAIAREGSEAVVFLYGTLAAASAGELPLMGLAAAVGLLLALLTFWLLQLGGKVLTWPRFFRVTEAMLLLLAASLVVTGVEQLQALEWLPPLVDGVWDSTWLLSDMGRVGGLVAALTGYRAQPSLMTVLAWLAFWILMAWLMRRSSARTSCPTAQPGPA